MPFLDTPIIEDVDHDMMFPSTLKCSKPQVQFWVKRRVACYPPESADDSVFACRADGCHWVPRKSKQDMFCHHNGCEMTFTDLLGEYLVKCGNTKQL